MDSARTNLLIGIWLFAAAITLCVLLQPQGLRLDFGLSYYGSQPLTVLPFALGVGGGALLLWSSAGFELPGFLRRTMRLFAICLVGVLLTPYRAGPVFDDLHTAIGSLAFLLALLQVAWIAARYRPRGVHLLDLALQLVAGVACALWVPTKTGYLLEAQLVFLAAWANSMLRIVDRPAAAAAEGASLEAA